MFHFYLYIFEKIISLSFIVFYCIVLYFFFFLFVEHIGGAAAVVQMETIDSVRARAYFRHSTHTLPIAEKSE